MKKPVLEIGAASVVRPGEVESGDLHLSARFRNGSLIAVVDGLGHGAAAAEAARIAVATLKDRPQDSVVDLVHRCHEKLRDSRGAVMSVASLNTRDQTLTGICVGNIKSVLLHFGQDAQPTCHYLVQRGGVVGSNLPPLKETLIPITAGDLLVMSTDGIETGYSQRLPFSSSPQQIADQVLAGFHKGTDDALVLVARYWGTRK